MSSIKGIINKKEVNSKMNVFQGPQGIPGKDGKDGRDGRDGRDGKDGITPDVTKIFDKKEILITYEDSTSETVKLVIYK